MAGCAQNTDGDRPVEISGILVAFPLVIRAGRLAGCSRANVHARLE